MKHDMDKCEFCDIVRQFFDLIKKCLAEDNKVIIEVADSVTVDPISTGRPK